MTCSDYRLLIPFRRTGDLLPEDTAALERHLSSCEACRSLAVPAAIESALQTAMQTVSVPANLKTNVDRAVVHEQRVRSARRAAQIGLLVSIVAVVGLIAIGLYRVTRPKLDTESLGFWNGYEADSGQVSNLVYNWLASESIPTDLPFQFEMKYFVSRGYERIGRAFVPTLKFQNQAATNGGSFAKVYFVRGADVDVRGAFDSYGSKCTVRIITGPNDLTYIIVHTGDDPAPFIRRESWR